MTRVTSWLGSREMGKAGCSGCCCGLSTAPSELGHPGIDCWLLSVSSSLGIILKKRAVNPRSHLFPWGSPKPGLVSRYIQALTPRQDSSERPSNHRPPHRIWGGLSCLCGTAQYLPRTRPAAFIPLKVLILKALLHQHPVAKSPSQSLFSRRTNLRQIPKSSTIRNSSFQFLLNIRSL